MRLNHAISLVALVLAACRAHCEPLPVRGWLIHTPDRAYINRVLAAAPRYGINHLDISHDFVHNIDEILERPGLAELVEQTARRCRDLGIEAFVWSHEFNTRQRDVTLDPSKPEGRAFWESRKRAYRTALKRCPSVAGVVLMFGSCPTEVWDPRITDSYWTGLTWPQRVQHVTRAVQSVVSGEMRRKLWVRDFNHGPAQLRALVEGLRDFPGITVYSKDAPQDFQLFYPHSFSIGAYGRTPQVLELDLNGEYWGQSATTVSLVRYLKYRIAYGVRKGVRGAVGRIDTYDNRALGTPSEINLYAFSRLLQDPATSEQAIYDGWIRRRYGLGPGSEPARRLQSILTRTLDWAKETYYTLGFWTPKNQSSMPRSLESIRDGIVSKSTALWDAKAAPLEQSLRNPDAEIVNRVLAAKRNGVGIADRNLRELAMIRASLKAADYDDLSARLLLASRVARIYETIAQGYWYARLIQEGRGEPGSDAAVRSAANDLVRWADRIETGDVPLPRRYRQAADLRSFAAQLRAVSRSTRTERNHPVLCLVPQLER